MKVNTILLAFLSIFLILFLFVSSVGAADVNETSNVLSVDESANMENNLLSVDNNVKSNDTLKVSNDEVLTAGNNWYVNGSKTSSGDGKSEFTAFKTLNEAINSASDYDIIMIASGEYKGIGINTGLDISKNLNFIKYGADEAIFDAENQRRIWTVTAISTNINGLTFKNGKTNSDGGAIYWNKGAKCMVTNCNFINNAANMGGAIACGGADAIVSYCAFVNNTASIGSEIFFVSSNVNLDYNWWGSNNPNWSNLIYGNYVPSVYAVLNLTANPNEILSGDPSNIVTKFVWNDTNTDATDLLPKRNVKLTSNGTLTKTEGNVGLNSQFSANTAGIYYINATADNEKIGVNIAVNLRDASVSVNNNTLDLNVDDTFTLIATTVPGGLNVTYTSNDTSVVTVNADGEITAQGEGTAIITAIVGGDGVYALNSTTVNITVNRIPTEIEIVSDTVTLNVSDSASAGASLTPADAGSLKYTSNNTEVATVDGNGVIKGLKGGSATITVSFDGNERYAPAESKTITVTVNPEVIVHAPDVTKYYNGPERFVVTVTDGSGVPIAGKSVIVNINDVGYSRTTDDKGVVSLALNLNSGVYGVSVVVDDITVKSTVNILSTVNGTDVVKVFRNATQYYATFRDSTGKFLPQGTIVTFNINGVMYIHVVDANGLAKLNINLPQGSYTITAINVATGEFCTNHITVISRILENKDLVKYYRNASQFVVKVIDSTGKAAPGLTVTYNVNGVFYYKTTDADGYARLNINLPPGDYIITSEIDGCRVANNIKVLPTLTASDMVKKYGTPDQFVASLVDGQGKPYANQMISFNIHGVFYNKLTDSNGQTKLNINLPIGEYIITSSYGEAKISNKITITS